MPGRNGPAISVFPQIRFRHRIHCPDYYHVYHIAVIYFNLVLLATCSA